jgi:RNA polymerase primary sigma factor
VHPIATPNQRSFQLTVLTRTKSARPAKARAAKSPPTPDSHQNQGNCQARTFSNPVLEESFREFCQLTHHGPDSIEPLDVKVRECLAKDLDCVANPAFESLDSEREVLGDSLLGTGVLASSTTKAHSPELNGYLAQLCEASLLTADQEIALFRRMNYLRYRADQVRVPMRAGDASTWDIIRFQALVRAADWHRDAIVNANMRLVISIVKKFVNVNNAFDDLLSEGIMALMRAVDKFNVELGFRFSTYATQVVRRHSYRLVMHKQAERQKVTASIQENGIDISDEDHRPSLDELLWTSLRTRLAVLLNKLDRREKLIIRARYSLGGHRRVQTLQKLADRLGVSKERVRQLEKRALEKLRILADSPD